MPAATTPFSQRRPCIRAAIMFCAAGIAQLTLGNSANATKCWRPTPAEHIERTALIFYAEVLRVPFLQLAGRQRIATLKVLRNYKGADVPLLRLLYLDDRNAGRARRGWQFSGGDKLLIFAAALPPAAGNTAADARASFCSMLPYHGRKALHPRYWDLLSALHGGSR